MRLIDADALLRAFEPEEWNAADIEAASVVGEIKAAPTIEATPVVHGRWESVKYTAHCSCGKSYGTYHYLCSACNRIAYAQPYGLTYCPNCGAKMDGDSHG